MTEYLEIEPWAPRHDLIVDVVKALDAGRLVACPTDTTFGVFADFEQRQAVERLTRLRVKMAGDAEAAAQLKGKPLAMIFPDLSTLSEYVILSGPAFITVKRLLPGPYTIILPASRAVPKRLQTKRRHVGARIPDHPIVQAIVDKLGRPVLSTTAKDETGALLGDPIALSGAWPHDIDLVIDGGWFFPEVSTVLAVENGAVTVVREGKGSLAGL